MFYKEKIFERVVDGGYFKASDEVKQIAWQDLIKLTQGVINKLQNEKQKEILFTAIIITIFKTLKQLLQKNKEQKLKLDKQVKLFLLRGWLDILFSNTFPETIRKA